MNWAVILELLFKYGPEVLKILLELINKPEADRVASGRNFAAMFLAATKQNDWKGMMLAQVCTCAMTLPEAAFGDFRRGLERVASGLTEMGQALESRK